MSLCGVGKFLIAEQFLNNINYMISMFFSKIRIICFLIHDSFVIFIIRNVDLLPLRAFIGPMSSLSTPITLVDPGFGAVILFVLCGCGGCYWCWHRDFDRLLC